MRTRRNTVGSETRDSPAHESCLIQLRCCGTAINFSDESNGSYIGSGYMGGLLTLHLEDRRKDYFPHTL